MGICMHALTAHTHDTVIYIFTWHTNDGTMIYCIASYKIGTNRSYVRMYIRLLLHGISHLHAYSGGLNPCTKAAALRDRTATSRIRLSVVEKHAHTPCARTWAQSSRMIHPMHLSTCQQKGQLTLHGTHSMICSMEAFRCLYTSNEASGTVNETVYRTKNESTDNIMATQKDRQDNGDSNKSCCCWSSSNCSSSSNRCKSCPTSMTGELQQYMTMDRHVHTFIQSMPQCIRMSTGTIFRPDSSSSSKCMLLLPVQDGSRRSTTCYPETNHINSNEKDLNDSRGMPIDAAVAYTLTSSADEVGERHRMMHLTPWHTASVAGVAHSSTYPWLEKPLEQTGERSSNSETAAQATGAPPGSKNPASLSASAPPQTACADKRLIWPHGQSGSTEDAMGRRDTSCTCSIAHRRMTWEHACSPAWDPAHERHEDDTREHEQHAHEDAAAEDEHAHAPKSGTISCMPTACMYVGSDHPRPPMNIIIDTCMNEHDCPVHVAYGHVTWANKDNIFTICMNESACMSVGLDRPRPFEYFLLGTCMNEQYRPAHVAYGHVTWVHNDHVLTLTTSSCVEREEEHRSSLGRRDNGPEALSALHVSWRRWGHALHGSPSPDFEAVLRTLSLRVGRGDKDLHLQPRGDLGGGEHSTPRDQRLSVLSPPVYHTHTHDCTTSISYSAGARATRLRGGGDAAEDEDEDEIVFEDNEETDDELQDDEAAPTLTEEEEIEEETEGEDEDDEETGESASSSRSRTTDYSRSRSRPISPDPNRHR